MALLLHILQCLIIAEHRMPCFSRIFWTKKVDLHKKTHRTVILILLDHMHGIHVTILVVCYVHFNDLGGPTQKLLHVPLLK